MTASTADADHAPRPVHHRRPRSAPRDPAGAGRARPGAGWAGTGLVLALSAALLAACGASSPTSPGPAATAPLGRRAPAPPAGTASGPVSTRPSLPGASATAPARAPGGADPAGPSWFAADPAEPLLGSLAGGRTALTGSGASPFPGGLLVADRGNGRILILSPSGRIVWRFPVAGSLPAGQTFSADDAFISPDGASIVANDEFHDVVDRIDIATRRVVWQYGHYGVASPGRGFLHTPDDAYPLANGDITVADIFNCRVLEVAPDKSVVRQWGRTGHCGGPAPSSLDQPNGDTPLPDGGMLVTDIRGSRVIRLSASGAVVFDIHVPVAYPSDAQLTPEGNVIVADFSSPGQVVEVSPTGRTIWRYGPSSGPGMLDHPSLATPLPGGLVSVNDDFRHRIVVIDPVASKIVWRYGTTDVPGRGPGRLDTPDGHEPLPVGLMF